MEVEKKSGRGKKEVSLIGLFGKQFLEEMQNKLAEAQKNFGTAGTAYSDALDKQESARDASYKGRKGRKVL